MEPGKFYLIACVWDWTYVGEYVGPDGLGGHKIRKGGYFTRTGATFDVLTTTGFVAETNFCSAHPYTFGIGPVNLWMEWHAPKPWVK
jgi:hypothetical protein